MEEKMLRGNSFQGEESVAPWLQLVAWEITRSCNLFCAHCQASAAYGPYQGELSSEECLSVIDDIVEAGRPVLILSGGEPLLRQDLFQIADYAVTKGLRETCLLQHSLAQTIALLREHRQDNGVPYLQL